MPNSPKMLFVAFMFIAFSYSAQKDSSLQKNKKWNKAIEISMDNYFFKERMPYYKNGFSFGATGNLCLVKTFKRNSNTTFNFRVGFGYVHYNIVVPELNRFFGVLFPSSPSHLYYAVDSCSYKTVRLRYFNIPISYTFNFRQKKKFGWGIGGEINFLNMPSSFAISESYSFEYLIPIKMPPFLKYTTQENRLLYNKHFQVPKTVLYFNYHLKKSNVILKLSKCLIAEALRQKDQQDKRSFNKYSNGYYNGSGGWNTINLWGAFYSGTAVSIMYQYVF